jgi:NAD(P)-dependent dehydrogenase (short-subunit alcohol dehydrogenase family)
MDESGQTRMRIVVVGGGGNFGARIVRALRGDPNIELLVAGRRIVSVPGAEDVTGVLIDIDDAGFAGALKAVSPGLVIHCVGPFQGQDYRVANAALAARAHYLDLADGRQFITEFAASVNAQAVSVDRVAISGASTLPALSSAVVDEFQIGMSSLESIEVTIAPGQRAPRGKATLEAVFSYLGRPFAVWREGRWRRAWGWMELQETRLDIGGRLAAACDVPDLELFPSRYAGVQTVRFSAALEFGVQHLTLWSLAALRRIGLPFPVDRWAVSLNRLAGKFDAAAGEKGGMRVSVVGERSDGRGRMRRTWQLTAPAMDGPEIPCMAAILLARRLARGDAFPSGAHPCVGFLTLSEFAPEFARWKITTRMEEVAA